MTAQSSNVLWLNHVEKADHFLTGEHAVTLGTLRQSGLPVPDGFIVTSAAYFRFLHENNIIPKIKQLLTTINYDHPESVMQVAAHIQKLLLTSSFSKELTHDMTKAYAALCGVFTNAPVIMHIAATRSILSAEQTFSNIHGDTNLLLKIKQAWAVFFEPQLITARHTKRIDHFQDGIAITVQKMITPEYTGTMTTIDPVTPDKTKCLIEVAGESIEHYIIDKNSPDPAQEQTKEKNQILSVSQLQELVTIGKKLEHLLYFPQEVTWAIERNTFYLLKIKPLHIHPQTQHSSDGIVKLPILLKGLPASKGIATGRVHRITKSTDMEKISHGDILVASDLTPSHKQFLKKSAGIVIENGGKTSPVAVFAREHGIPAVVKAEHAIKTLKQGHIITIDGMLGNIYRGSAINHPSAKSVTRIFALIDNIEQLEDKNEDRDGILFFPADKPHNLKESLTSVCEAAGALPVLYRIFDSPEDGENPLIGFRGTYHALHQPTTVQEELQAIQYLRKRLEYKHISILLPFVRSIHEVTAAKHLMAEYGLFRSAEYKLWIEAATPSTLLQITTFIEAGIDGIVLAVDTIASLFLGVDKDNSKVAHAYDVLDPAVLHALENTLRTANKHGIKTVLYGQALTYHSSLIEKIISWGATGIAVEPNYIHQIRNQILETEHRLIEQKYT